MAHTRASEQARQRILRACVRLFLQKGYHKTTVAEILRAAEVSASTFQNLFRAKEGVLGELIDVMFAGQFAAARGAERREDDPILVYAVETCLQLTLTELDENLRDIYLEAYTSPAALERIHTYTAEELSRIFAPYHPGAKLSDFYEMELGSAGIMRGYMAQPCTIYFPLERKLARFLQLSLGAYGVPAAEQARAQAHIAGMDMRALAMEVMQRLFARLAMKFDFTLDGAEQAGNTSPEIGGNV